ncbi:MAG: ABC transporter substrate-binding protein [Solirubrobacterales bacterium]|nr:ABC transporter substrate-binding protein [Solirubrobacterales bacterium]
MIRPLTALLAVLAAVTLTACGAKDETPDGTPKTERLTLVLDYFPNADHAGIYAAQAAGFFRQAGLDVDIQVPGDPAAPTKLVQARKADIAISYEPEVLLARDKGAAVVSFGALVQKPLTSLMSLPSGRVRGPEDLKGRTVGTAGIPYQSAYLKTILKQAGVGEGSVKEVNVGFNLVPAMLSKRVDATLGAFWNYEGVQLRREGKHPRIVRMEDAGVPAYNELVFIAERDTLRERGDVLRRFLQAVGRGHKLLREDPAKGVEPLLKANKDLDRGLQLAAVKATLPVFFPENGKPFGWQDLDAWKAYGDWMVENDLLKRAPTPTALTNEFVPGQGI